MSQPTAQAADGAAEQVCMYLVVPAWDCHNQCAHWFRNDMEGNLYAIGNSYTRRGHVPALQSFMGVMIYAKNDGFSAAVCGGLPHDRAE